MMQLLLFVHWRRHLRVLLQQFGRAGKEGGIIIVQILRQGFELWTFVCGCQKGRTADGVRCVSWGCGAVRPVCFEYTS